MIFRRTKMIRKIIQIDSEKCNGCGACADACHEGAIAMVDGKAKLMRDDYCDGLGNCLPACPTGAITFVEREAAAYDEEAVRKAQQQRPAADKHMHTQAQSEDKLPCGCPGTHSRVIRHVDHHVEPKHQEAGHDHQPPQSQLAQWPVQIQLAPVNAPYFKGAKLLIAADCTAYAFAGFHDEFMRGRVTLIGCPKLDDADYSDKLAEILSHNDIEDITVVRMEVPCCRGIVDYVKSAMLKSGKMIPWQVAVISTDGIKIA